MFKGKFLAISVNFVFTAMLALQVIGQLFDGTKEIKDNEHIYKGSSKRIHLRKITRDKVLSGTQQNAITTYKDSVNIILNIPPANKS
jgi:hypothetical protein